MELTDADRNSLARLGIRALILFGSRAQGIAGPMSDYDFFVIGKGGKTVYDGLYDLLSARINQLVDIDIVFDDAAPLELKNHVATYGRVLYEADRTVCADFRERTMTQSADFAPLRAVFTDATLARISL